MREKCEEEPQKYINGDNPFNFSLKETTSILRKIPLGKDDQSLDPVLEY